MKSTNTGNKPQTADTIRYTTCNDHCFSMCVLSKCTSGTAKSGRLSRTTRLTAASRGRTGNCPDELIDKCMIAVRPCTKGYAHIRNLNAPNRVIYPMKRAGEKGERQMGADILG